MCTVHEHCPDYCEKQYPFSKWSHIIDFGIAFYARIAIEILQIETKKFEMLFLAICISLYIVIATTKLPNNGPLSYPFSKKQKKTKKLN